METIKEEAKKSIIKVLNRLLQVEYDIIFNYPKVIDKLVNLDKIKDEKIIQNIEEIGKESLHHFTVVDTWIHKLGGETIWHIDAVDPSMDFEGLLRQQLEREKWAISWYQEAKRIAEQNKVKIRDFFGRVARNADKLPEDYLDANELISSLEKNIADEEKHIRLVNDSDDRWRMLKHV